MLFWILVMVAYILLAALFFELLKSVLKALLSATGVIAVIVIILGIVVIVDARDFVEESKAPGQLFILQEDGKMLAGVKDLFMQDENATKKLDEDEFLRYSTLYNDKKNEKRYDAILEDQRRVFVIDIGAFGSLTDKDFEAYPGFSRDLIYRMLRSESAVNVLVDKTIRDSNVTKEYEELLRREIMKQIPGESDMRSSVFMILLDAPIRKDGPLFLIRQLKEKRMEVHPNSMMFRAMDIIPMALFDMAGERLKQNMGKENG